MGTDLLLHGLDVSVEGVDLGREDAVVLLQFLVLSFEVVYFYLGF